MADIVAKTERKRKMNFSISEINKITEKVEENLLLLQSKFNNAVTNKKKQEVWLNITAEVNCIGVAERSVQEVKDKWKNLQCSAKKEFANYKSKARATGGGPPPKAPTEATEKIIKLFEFAPSFAGLKGFESTGCDSSDYESSFVDEATVVLYPNEPLGAIEQFEVPVQPLEVPAIELDEVVVEPEISEARISEGSRRETRKRKLTRNDVLQLQYEVLASKKENLELKKQKLRLEVLLLQRKVDNGVIS